MVQSVASVILVAASEVVAIVTVVTGVADTVHDTVMDEGPES